MIEQILANTINHINVGQTEDNNREIYSLHIYKVKAKVNMHTYIFSYDKQV